MAQCSNAAHLTWCPQAVLALAVLGEAGGEHEPVLQIHGLGALGPLVRHGLLLHVAVARVHAADLLVFAGEQHLAAVPVPAGAQHQLRQPEGEEALAGAHVPDADVVVAAGGEEDVLRAGVPEHDADPALVEHEVHHALGHGAGHAAVGDLPHLHRAVLAGGGCT